MFTFRAWALTLKVTGSTCQLFGWVAVSMDRQASTDDELEKREPQDGIQDRFRFPRGLWSFFPGPVVFPEWDFPNIPECIYVFNIQKIMNCTEVPPFGNYCMMTQTCYIQHNNYTHGTLNSSINFLNCFLISKCKWIQSWNWLNGYITKLYQSGLPERCV